MRKLLVAIFLVQNSVLIHLTLYEKMKYKIPIYFAKKCLNGIKSLWKNAIHLLCFNPNDICFHFYQMWS